MDARLVVLGIDHPYSKEAGNAAEVAAKAIFETRGDVTTEVWTYPAAPPNDQLVKLFGFDPVRWKPAPEGTSRYYGGRTGRRDRS